MGDDCLQAKGVDTTSCARRNDVYMMKPGKLKGFRGTLFLSVSGDLDYSCASFVNTGCGLDCNFASFSAFTRCVSAVLQADSSITCTIRSHSQGWALVRKGVRIRGQGCSEACSLAVRAPAAQGSVGRAHSHCGLLASLRPLVRVGVHIAVSG